MVSLWAWVSCTIEAATLTPKIRKPMRALLAKMRGNERAAQLTEPSNTRSSATLAGQYRKFFAASVAAVALLQVTIVTDTIIVGQLLGPVPMSGVRVASPIVNILNVIAMLVGVGVGVTGNRPTARSRSPSRSASRSASHLPSW